MSTHDNNATEQELIHIPVFGFSIIPNHIRAKSNVTLRQPFNESSRTNQVVSSSNASISPGCQTLNFDLDKHIGGDEEKQL